MPGPWENQTEPGQPGQADTAGPIRSAALHEDSYEYSRRPVSAQGLSSHRQSANDHVRNQTTDSEHKATIHLKLESCRSCNIEAAADDAVGRSMSPSDARPAGPLFTSKPETKAKVKELYGLEHHSGPHRTPDALLRIPENFDPKKPVHLVIYNHGFYTNVSSSFQEAGLSDAMERAEPNTVLIIPEWQAYPGAESAKQGEFAKPGVFKKMLQDVFNNTRELAGLKVADIDRIDIFAHSAGHIPAETEIYNNELSEKIRSVTLFDSLYDGTSFDDFIGNNIAQFSSGAKRFYNFFRPIYEDSPAESPMSKRSKALASRVKDMLQYSGLSLSSVNEDYDQPDEQISTDQIAQHPIVFKASSKTIGKQNAHFTMPKLNFSQVLEALRSDR